jgi:hypothetical protein
MTPKKKSVKEFFLIQGRTEEKLFLSVSCMHDFVVKSKQVKQAVTLQFFPLSYWSYNFIPFCVFFSVLIPNVYIEFRISLTVYWNWFSSQKHKLDLHGSIEQYLWNHIFKPIAQMSQYKLHYLMQCVVNHTFDRFIRSLPDFLVVFCLEKINNSCFWIDSVPLT